MPFRSRQQRRGAILPLVAVMLVLILTIVAFSIDIGYISRTKQELQNVADASALAGAAKLLSRSQLTGSYNAASTMSAAETAAQNVAKLNSAGGVPIALNANTSNAPGGDIVCGYLLNPSDPSCPMSTNKTPYNSVQVTASRTAQVNGSLKLFFANVFGTKSFDMTATATATYDGNIKGFRFSGAGGSQSCSLLPFALDVNTWNLIVSGSGPDVWSYNPITKAVTSGSDGIKEAKLYPSNTGSPGNFGTVNVGVSNNGTTNLIRQILYGPNSSDLANMGGQVALGSNGTLTLIGNPGLSAAIKSSLQSIIGQPRTIFLYQPPVALSGANAQYTIIGFAGVIITQVKLTGLQKSVTIQPEIVTDRTAFGGGPITTNRFVYPSLQMTR